MTPHQLRTIIRAVARTAVAITPILPIRRGRGLALVGLGSAAVGAAAGALLASPDLRHFVVSLVKEAPQKATHREA